MKRFLTCTVLLVVVPMALLNPMGREAFLAYYAGVIAMWATFVLAGQQRSRAE